MRPDPIGSSEPRFPVDSRESASFRDTRSQPAAGLNPPRSRRFKPVSSTREAPVDHEIRRGIFMSGAPTRPKRLRRVALPLEFRRRAATSSPTIRSSATTREPPSPVDGDAAFRVRAQIAVHKRAGAENRTRCERQSLFRRWASTSPNADSRPRARRCACPNVRRPVVRRSRA